MQSLYSTYEIQQDKIMDLRQFRKDHHLSQNDVAEIFGCKQNHVSAIEVGTRSLTPLHIRLLIDKYGLETIAKYADPGELPQSQQPVVTVNAPVVRTNSGQMQVGDGNEMKTSSAENDAVVERLLGILQKKDEQIDRLIALLEQKM